MPFVGDWRQMAIENTASSDFDQRSSIVKSVLDCRLSGMLTMVKNILSEKLRFFSSNQFKHMLRGFF